MSRVKPSGPAVSSFAVKSGGLAKKPKSKRKNHATINTDGGSSSDLNASFRLQTDEVIPTHYTLCIKPDFEDFSFEGCVSIALKIKKETKYVIMNAIDLNITKIMWEEDVTENKQEPLEFFIDVENQTLRIFFEPSLLPSTGCIRINFNSMISHKLTGLYCSKYTLPNSEEGGFHLMTKFEPIYARTCFPCFDEPSFKVTFDLSLIVPKDLLAISNMPLKITYPHRTKAHLKIVEFDKTPLMSTYLLAFAIGHFGHLEYAPRTSSTLTDASPPETATPEGTAGSTGAPPPKIVPCRIYTVPGKQHEGEFALAICVKLMIFYKKYFEVAYPLPKLDLLATPELMSGGMENWGLITLKESRVLLTQENARAFNSARKVAILIAHELAHMWWGDLVTMEWWTHLWISEGFATYLEFVALDHLFPDFHIWTVFYTDTVLEVLKIDGLKNSHAVEVPIAHPNDIKEIFDHISYNKGAALLSMLVNYIGEKAFRKSLTHFLNKFQYKNATTSNLWKVFDSVSGKPVGSVMTSWTRKQMGYPIIRVIATKYENNSRTLTLTQEKFWYDQTMRESRVANKDYLWIVPLAFAVGSNPTKIIKEVLMEKKTLIVTIPNIGRSQWIKINPGAIGYYRVKYMPEMIMQFHQCIRNRTLPPLDRIGVLDDMFAFAQAGLNSILEIFSLLEAFSDEDNYTVWTQLNSILDSLDQLLWHTEYYEKFHTFCRSSMNNILERIGYWKHQVSEDSVTMRLRALVLSRMVLSGHEETAAMGEQHFRQHMSGEEVVPVQLRSVVYQSALVKGIPADTLKLLLKRYKDTDSHEEQECIIHSLNALRNPDLIQDVLDFSITGNVHPPQTLHIIKTLAKTRAGHELAWQFFKTHQNLLRGMYSPSIAYTQLVQAVTENFASEMKAVEVVEFFHEKYGTHPGLERTILQVVEKIRMAEAWVKRENDLIQDYLSTYYD